MGRQEITARDGYTKLGYIEGTSDGRQRAVGKDGYTTLGYYDPKRNETVNKDGYTKLATGNVLSGLIYQNR